MEKGQKPNLLFVFADQLSRNRLGFGGDAFAGTPFLDAFAASCADLSNAVSGHPLGGPYRASLFTGQYSTSTGMVINALRMHPNHRFFAQILNENGYRTGFIGKWNLYSAKLGKSHTVKHSFVPPGEYRFGFNDYFAAYDYHHRYFAPAAFYHLESEEKQFARGFEPDFQTQLAVDRLGAYAESGEPFALFLSFGTPHGPWERENVLQEDYEAFAGTKIPLPENYAEKNDPHADAWARLNKRERALLPEWLRCYYAMTADLDRNVSRLIAALEEKGLADNTVFVFTADHGEMFGAHGRRGKNIFYREAISVPFLIKYGSQIPAGVNETPLSTVDIMPTLLSLMGVADHGQAQGADLSREILAGENAENPCLLMGTGPTAVWGGGREWRAMCTRNYIYATYISGREEFLFDRRNDPLEMNNLAGSEELKKEQLRLKTAMLAKMAMIGDDFEPNGFYKKNWVKKGRVLRDPLLKRRDAGAKR